MNKRFETYLSTLTPSKRLLAREAVEEYLHGEGEQEERLETAEVVYRKCRHLAVRDEEHAIVLLTNNRLRLIKAVEVGTGTQTECLFDIRTIFREAILNKATKIFLVHNHPTGNTRPSSFDDKLTKDVKQAGDIMRINLVDHVIICNDNYYSYREEGKL